jgi:PAS domain-containing protein
VQALGHVDILDINHKSLAVDGGVGGLGFCLSASGTAELEARVHRLDQLSPHLCRAFEASLLMSGSAHGRRQMSVVLDLMHAALLLDGRGRIIQANGAAEALLRQSDGIAFDAGGSIQLVSALPSERQAPARALKEVLDQTFAEVLRAGIQASTLVEPRDQFGWAAGAGVESFIATSNWIARLEYLHYDFGNVDQTHTVTRTAPAFASSDHGGHQTVETVRAGVSYKFTQ